MAHMSLRAAFAIEEAEADGSLANCTTTLITIVVTGMKIKPIICQLQFQANLCD